MSGFLTATEVLNASILRILASSGVAVNSGFMVDTVAGAKKESLSGKQSVVHYQDIFMAR